MNQCIPEEPSHEQYLFTYPASVGVIFAILHDDKSHSTEADFGKFSSTNSSTIFKSGQISKSPNHNKYTASRQKKIDGFIKRGVFEIANKDHADGTRTYGARFVNRVKH